MQKIYVLISEKVHAAELKRHSKSTWKVTSNVTFDWTLENVADGQIFRNLRFGVVDNTESQIQFYAVTSDNTLLPPNGGEWPAAWTWYRNRFSWTGDVKNSNRIIFKLAAAAMNDSRKFFVEVNWNKPIAKVTDVVRLVITGEFLL